jgi:seryl-tRNA synthetase
MLDIKFIRENAELIQEGAKKKRIDFDIKKLIEVDDKRKVISQELEGKRAKQNEVSQKIPKANPTEREALIKEMQPLKEEMQKLEGELKEVMIEWQKLMIAVPNIPDMSVPDGDDETGNVEIRKWPARLDSESVSGGGEIPKFNFTPKNNMDLMLALDMVDVDRGAKVAGFRGYFLKNDAALLQFALWHFVQDFFAKKSEKEKSKWTPMIVPSLVKREVFLGTGYIPQGEEDLYKTQDGDFLSGTAEVATMGYYMDEVIDKKNLPIKMISFADSFRREAGSHGKDTKGILRVHEFYKFEQVILCEASHELSVKHHEELTANAEGIMQALKIPYHVVANCGGDLGLGQVKKYDVEAWFPSENRYRETHSSSYFHDFQTRRLNIKYRDTDGKLKFVHSLNNTALSGRPLLAIVENYQQADGSVIIPEVLRPYMGGRDKISKKSI